MMWRCVQAADLKTDLQGMQSRTEHQERDLGGALQKIELLEDEVSQLHKDVAALSQQKAEVERLQETHADHAHIFR